MVPIIARMASKRSSNADAPHRDLNGILRRASAGDQEALAEAFAQFRPLLKKSVAARMDRRLLGRFDASDVVQETYLDASRRLDEYCKQPGRMPILLWMRLLSAQRLVDLHRQHLGARMRDATMEISLDQATGLQSSSFWLTKQLVDQQQSSASQAAMRAELRKQVYAALDCMDPLDREVLTLRHFEQLSNNEVALMLRISVKASSNRYVRALRRLEKFLATEAKGDLGARQS